MTGDPERLGKYQLVGVIGKGAMGVVHRAFDPVLNRTVAIKVMSGVIANDQQLRERFLREARAAGSLQHPNVITIYDFGEMDDSLFIAMEYVDGYDLSEIIAKRVPLAVEAKLDILIDTLGGLDYAHSRGVVHRDIKPANIRINVDGRAKLMDFGIAHMQESDLTRSGDMIGTPQYMAPEQIQEGPITPATDIFSLGCVAYELFANAKPFLGATLHAVLFEIVSGDTPSLAATGVANIPEGLAPIIEKALAKDPAARYASAAEMSREIQVVRNRLRVPAAQASIVTREIMRTTMELPSTLAGGTVASFARPSVRRPLVIGGALGLAAVAALAWFVLGRATPAPATIATAAQAPAAAASVPSATASTALAPSAPAPAPAAATPSRTPASPAASAPRAAAPDATLATLRAAALESRGEAVVAGASTEDLAAGETALRAGDDLAARSRTSDAIVRYSTATQLWAGAERSARQRAQEAAAKVAAVPLSRPESPKAESVAPVTAPVTAPVPVALPPSAPATVAVAVAVDARPAISAVIAQYELAIESGDIARIRAVLPSLTAAQQSNWEAFYRTARRFRATLTITQLDTDGARATAQVGAVYEYDNASTGRPERHELKLQAALRNDGAAWRLGEIR